MNFVSRNLKLKTMKKENDFIIYPCLETDNIVKLQSDTRILNVNLETGLTVQSIAKPRGAFNIHLLKELGAFQYQMDDKNLQIIKQMKEEISKRTMSDRSIFIT